MLACQIETLADWRLARPEAVSQGFVDDHDRWRVGVVLRREAAPQQERDAQRLKVITVHHIEVEFQVFTLARSITFGSDAGAVAVIADRDE